MRSASDLKLLKNNILDLQGPLGIELLEAVITPTRSRGERFWLTLRLRPSRVTTIRNPTMALSWLSAAVRGWRKCHCGQVANAGLYAALVSQRVSRERATAEAATLWTP